MSVLLAIDPGVTCPGAAVFDLETKRLVAARYFKGEGFKDDLSHVVDLALEITLWSPYVRVAHVAFEWPQIYGGRRSGGGKDPNDMLALAAFNGALAAALWHHTSIEQPFTIYRAHEWKGSKKKNPTARMVIERLHEDDETPNVEEIAEFIAALEKAGEKECKHPTMNALDAVGIGLHHLGRLARRRVIAR